MERTRPGDQSKCPRTGLPLSWRKGQAGNLMKLSKEKCKVLQPLAMTEGWELLGWGENKFHRSQQRTAAPLDVRRGLWPGDAEKQSFSPGQPLASLAPSDTREALITWSKVSRGPLGWLWGEALARGLEGSGLLSLEKRHQTPESAKGPTEERPGSPLQCIPAG